MFGTGTKLMARINAPTSKADRIPPRLSTESVVSFTWAGTSRHAMKKATAANGSVTTKTDPHANCSRSRPAINGPSEAIAPPVADQSAMECVRAGPDQRAAIIASVVGYAMPAERPPRSRAPIRTSMLGANAASRQAGTDNATPVRSISFRP